MYSTIMGIVHIMNLNIYVENIKKQTIYIRAVMNQRNPWSIEAVKF